MKALSEMLIANKDYNALRHILANSIDLDLEASEVQILSEMVNKIPRQGQRKQAQNKKRTVTERKSADPKTVPETTPRKPRQKRTKNATPTNDNIPPHPGDGMFDDGVEHTTGDRTDTPTPS